jgi:hypothetical protein
MKTKTYVITVSRTFPKTHARAGENTYFVQKIRNALHDYKESSVDCYDENGNETCVLIRERKIHTIRGNYELWEKRMAEVQKGNAVISLRYWSGKPYNSKQVEICQLDKGSGCGVQELSFLNSNFSDPIVLQSKHNPHLTRDMLAINDGLSLDDFKEWFKGYDLSKPMAIIHFTNFRY